MTKKTQEITVTLDDTTESSIGPDPSHPGSDAQFTVIGDSAVDKTKITVKKKEDTAITFTLAANLSGYSSVALKDFRYHNPHPEHAGSHQGWWRPVGSTCPWLSDGVEFTGFSPNANGGVVVTDTADFTKDTLYDYVLEIELTPADASQGPVTWILDPQIHNKA